VYVYRSCWSKLIIFAHNIIIYFGVLLYYEIWPGAIAILALPGLLLVLLNGAFMSLYIGMVSARFRDIPQLIGSFVQIVFFITPIFWPPTQLTGSATIFVDANMLYHYIEIVRNPLLGKPPGAWSWLMVLIATVVGWTIALYVYSRFRRRIPYWL